MYLSKLRPQITFIFLAVELILYILILTTGGNILVTCSYAAIVLCFLYALLHWRNGNHFIIAGLACTVIADFFLVVCSPIQQLWGMRFFLGTQTLYAVMLHLSAGNKKLLIARGIVILLAPAVTFAVLQEKTDALAVISLCYYANLILNIITAFAAFPKNWWFALALVLFALCDTVIGLQVASDAYLPFSENSLLYRIIFMDFNLSWFFYFPSQVMIALSAKKDNKR